MICKDEGRLLLSNSQTRILGTIFFLESLFVIFTNLLLLLSLLKTKQLDTTSKKYIFALNLSDFCMGILGIPLYGILFIKYGSKSFCLLDLGAKSIIVTNVYFTLCMLLFIAIDRSNNIVPEFSRPNRIGEFVSSSAGFNSAVIISFVVALTFGIIFIIDSKVTRLVRTITDIVAILIYVLLYIHLYLKTQHFRKKTRKIMSHSGRSESEAPELQYTRSLKMTVLILVGVVNLCYIPIDIIKFIALYWMFGRKEPITPTIWFLYYLFSIPVFANSGLNSVIILCRNKKLKSFVMNWMCRSEEREA